MHPEIIRTFDNFRGYLVGLIIFTLQRILLCIHFVKVIISATVVRNIKIAVYLELPRIFLKKRF